MASEAGEGSTAGMDDYETLISTTDVELLKKAWRNEKAAPEILRFETSLIQRIRGQIQLMEENIEEFAGSGIDPLTVSLYQMDLDRTQYLFRSYLRIRLQKIEKYMFHISKNPEVQSRLSEQEKGFARRCADDMERHLEESVLSKLPDNYQDIVKQSIISEESDMIPEPQLDSFVVCKSRRFLGPFQLDGSDELLEMKPDELCIIHYKSIRERVQEGDIDLEENIEEFAGSGIDPLTVSLYQMDLDRTQYLFRSYLRIRLQKIEKYMFHISKNPEVQSRLSEQEKGFARRCADDMERHLEESVLSKLPDNYQDIVKQSIISEESDMIPEPQLDSFVVCKSRRFLGPFQLDGSDELLEMKPDELCIIHYKSIRERVQEGDIDLV